MQPLIPMMELCFLVEFVRPLYHLADLVLRLRVPHHAVVVLQMSSLDGRRWDGRVAPITSILQFSTVWYQNQLYLIRWWGVSLFQALVDGRGGVEQKLTIEHACSGETVAEDHFARERHGQLTP